MEIGEKEKIEQNVINKLIKIKRRDHSMRNIV